MWRIIFIKAWRYMHVCKNGYKIQNFDIVSIPPISSSEPTPRKNVADYGLVVEQLIRFVCTSNIQLHAMDNEYFRQALYILNPEFDFPLRETMPKRIIEFADELKNKTYEQLANQRGSLLYDSAKKWSRNYQGVICQAQNELFLLSLDITKDNKAETITPIIIDVIQKLQKHNSEVIAICPDSDNTNKSVFDPDKGIIRKVSKDNFIRQTCCEHIANLVIEDTFVRNDSNRFIFENIHAILQNENPHNLKKSGFPHIQTIRWNSLYYCVKYIVKNIIKNTDSINNEVQKCIDTIESKITWENLLNIQKIMNNYIKLVEKDETNLSSMMNEFIYTYNHLSNNESQVSQCLAECLFERFFNDFPLKLPAFAYILTREGLIYVFSAPEDD